MAMIRRTNNSVFPKKSCKDVFHAFMLEGCELDGYFDIPLIKATGFMPESLISFSEAIRQKRPSGPGMFIHFYEHDQKFERFWNNPRRYLKTIRRFAGVISPDFSLYRDMPDPLKRFNNFRNFTCGAWLQNQGLQVIANVRSCGYDSFGYALAGAPKNSVIAIGTHGFLKNLPNRLLFIEEIRFIVDLLQPSAIIVFGSTAYGVFDYAKRLGVDVRCYPAQASKMSGCGNNE